MVYAQPLEKKDQRRINKKSGQTDRDTWDLFLCTRVLQTRGNHESNENPRRSYEQSQSLQDLGTKPDLRGNGLTSERRHRPEFRQTIQRWGMTTSRIANVDVKAGLQTPPDLMVFNEVYTYGFGLKADWAASTRSRPLGQGD